MKFPCKQYIIHLVLVFYCLSLKSQGKEVVFHDLPPGLSSKLVKCILKDSKGYLWFGTDDGLNKYDGINFTVFENNPEDPYSLSHNIVNCLLEDKNNNLWVGAAEGLNLYDRSKNRFIRISDPDSAPGHLNNQCISSLYEDDLGIIWIGTIGSGLIKYNPAGKKFSYLVHSENNPRSISSNFVTGITTDKEKNSWIGTRNGLNMIEFTSGRINRFQANSAQKNCLTNDQINTLFKDSQGNIWIGTQGGGLNRLVQENGKYSFNHYLYHDKYSSISTNYILSICEDSEGKLWVGTENGGLNLLDISTGKFTQFLYDEINQNSLKSNSIWSLFKDNANILWVGTYNKGVAVFDENENRFSLIQRNNFIANTLTNNNVTCFAEDKNGNLWIGTDGGGLNYFDTQTRKFKNTISSGVQNSLVSKAIMALLIDRNETLWVGTWAGGVDRFTASGKKVKNYVVQRKLGNGNNNIISLYEDKEGSVWAGSAGSGLFRYNSRTDEFEPVVDSNKSSKIINTAYVTSILEDSDNTIWVTTLYGLVCIKKQKDNKLSFKNIFRSKNNKGLSSNQLTIVYEDSKQNLWFGTEDKGVNLYNKSENTFKSFQRKDGLPNNSIKGILEDERGVLWISTNKGICQFNPKTKEVKNYNTQDGLNSDEFYAKSGLKTRHGEFYFGGNNGFNSFYPVSFKINPNIPPVYLSDIMIFNKSLEINSISSPLKEHISETSEIRLTYNQTTITLEFTALNYTQPSKNQYTCILKGFETEWHYLGSNHTVTYTNLNPGKYTFMVKGSNNDGLWNSNPAILDIIIPLPWWKSVWALIAYVIIFFLLLFAFISLLLIRARQSHSLKLERMAREKDEELNKLKLQFFTNVSHELRTPLSLIITPLESILSAGNADKKMRDRLMTVLRSANRLMDLVNELMDFRKIDNRKLELTIQQGDIIEFTLETAEFFRELALKKNIDYQITSPSSNLSGWFDKNKLGKILLNLFSNAIKFTPENGWVKISIGTDFPEKFNKHIIRKSDSQRFFCFEISNSGRGIDPRDLPYIFERFYQGNNLENKKYPGTGIGLALTKSLTELHRGNIFVESKPDLETKFTVIIPVGKEDYYEDEFAALSGLAFQKERFQLVDNSNTATQQKEMPKTNEDAILLIVEDNEELRHYLVKELSKSFQVVEACDGQEGIVKAYEHIPDLVISDILMPVKDGIVFCKELKADLRTSHIPVILLTARTAIEDQIEGIETGADLYITKPFNIRFLLAQIVNLIESRKKLYALFSQEAYMKPAKIANNQLDKEFVDGIIDFILENISDTTLSVDSLASFSKLSRSQIYRKIKALTGISAVEFIRLIRLKQAIKLMETKKYSLSEIAYETGFNSPSYFTRSFKEQFGKVPSEYLK